MATLDLIDLGDENWGTRQNANLTALNNAKQEIATLDADVAALAADSGSALRTELNAAIVEKVATDIIDSYAAAASTEVPETAPAIVLRGYHDGDPRGTATYVRVDTEPTHDGKLQTADGAWWEIAEPVLMPEMFGARPVPRDLTDIATVQADYDCTVPFNAASTAAKALRRPVRISEGRWAHSGTLTWYTGVSYFSHSIGDNWAAANTIAAVSSPRSKYEATSGAVFVAFGTFAKTFTMPGITRARQMGFGRDIPVAERPFNNGLDARIDLWDGTNLDAAGATPATLKSFSVAHHFDGADLERFSIRGMTFAINCPNSGEGFGLGGYAALTEVVPWADVDFGVYCASPWRADFNFSVIGYTNERGLLINSQTNGYLHRGYAEHNVFDGCFIQNGVAVRTPDSWPVIAKTANTITVRWTESHQFTATGTLRIGSTTWTASVFNYSAVSYSSTDGGTLTFTVAESTEGVLVTGDDRSHVWGGAGAGYALTVFRDCEFYDFAHSTLVDPVSSELGSRARPFAAAIEISGYIRAVRFENSTARPLGPFAMNLGHVDDIEFVSCWVEPRPGKMLVADTTYRTSGSAIVAGPVPSMLAEVGVRGIGNVHLDSSRNIFHSVNRAPVRPSASTYRMSSMTDLVTLIWRDEGEERMVRYSSDTTLYAQHGHVLDLRGRSADGTLTRALQTYTAGGTGLGVEPGLGAKMILSAPSVTPGNILIRAELLPGSGLGLNLGAASNRWGTIYANTGTINTSDEREKEQVREITSAEMAVAGDLKNLLRAFKWKDAVGDKGSAARIHFGVVAQEVVKVFQNWGLNAHDYGLLCYDEWDEQPEIRNNEGEIEQEYRPAGNRYGVRYDELLAFIIAAL